MLEEVATTDTSTLDTADVADTASPNDTTSLPDGHADADALPSGDTTEVSDVASDGTPDQETADLDTWEDLPDVPPDLDVVADLDVQELSDSSDADEVEGGDGDLDASDADVPDPVDPCSISETWTSIYGGQPYCPAYTIQENWDATYCEFYLNSIGDGYEGHYGIPFHWLEAYIALMNNEGTILGAGMMTEYKDLADGKLHQRFSYGAEIGPYYWKTGFTYFFTGYMGDGSYSYEVQEFAFFVDIERPNGTIVRLWQSNFGANYAWNDAFGLPTSSVSIPYGHVDYANDDSKVFDQKKGCK